jgi:hypothetical protein
MDLPRKCRASKRQQADTGHQNGTQRAGRRGRTPPRNELADLATARPAPQIPPSLCGALVADRVGPLRLLQIHRRLPSVSRMYSGTRLDQPSRIYR